MTAIFRFALAFGALAVLVAAGHAADTRDLPLDARAADIALGLDDGKCNFDSDCPSGVKCHSGKCATATGSKCNFDSDCGGKGAKCHSGKCSNAPDGKCNFDSECPGGKCSSGKCKI